ncbi:Ribonuclease p protein subunit p38-like protein [Thalictrum thalictroides]|uniref:Ribonuclease p protein subunit p38-like protein n=1 Tax=Thalictrum thalictroides TaxID=46969 RepID=A0A7J6UV50_THATH|nr:Ribonuclease p protein subunit p38-like protein [Thalictrum thalictroides]
MAAEVVVVKEIEEQSTKHVSSSSTSLKETVISYFGISLAIYLGFLPRTLESRNKALCLKLNQVEEQLKQMKSRRKEDSKANARVVEIFASHRNGWQQEEKKLLQQIETSNEEISHLRFKIQELEKSETELRNCVENLKREVDEREEMINFMSRRQEEDNDDDDDEEEEEENVEEYEEEAEEEERFADKIVEKVEVRKELEEEVGDRFYHGTAYTDGEENGEYSSNFVDFSRFDEMRISEGLDPVPEEYFMDVGSEMAYMLGRLHNNGLSRDFLPSASTVWAERGGDWQDVRCDSLESSYPKKHFAARRESPWKVDCESTGVPSKLKLLEQELLDLEKIYKGEPSKFPSLLRKQAKRYQVLVAKIDDLCRKMRTNDPCDTTLSSEFRTRRQTEFLSEAHRLKQRAIETGQKLAVLQTEFAKGNFSNDLESHVKFTKRRSLDSIRNNLKEIQRNLEVWLARIMGELEGILARDGASRVKEYYMSRYPFVQ